MCPLSIVSKNDGLIPYINNVADFRGSRWHLRQTPFKSNPNNTTMDRRNFRSAMLITY